MLYAGAPCVSKGHAVRNYRFDEAVAQVDQFLHSYDVPVPADVELAG